MNRFLSVILSFTLVLTQALPVFGSELPTHRYETYIEILQGRDVIEETEIDQDEAVTIEQFLRYGLRNMDAFDRRGGFDEPTFRFSNIPNILPYAKYVYTALNAGIIEMTPDKRFNPDKTLTKYEALKLAFNLYGVGAPKIHDLDHEFTDVPARSEVQAIIAKAMDLDLIGPEEINFFGINNKMTVGETARLFAELHDVFKNVAQPTEVLVGLPDVEDIDVFFDVYSKIEEFYYYEDEINQEHLTKKAIQGLVNGLDDRYSVFNEPVETNTFIEQTSGDFQGVGMWIETDGTYITVAGVIPDSPAEIGGMKVGDTILKINGQDIQGWSPEKASAQIKGPEGTNVELYVERKANKTKVTVTLTRRQISLKFVEGKKLQQKYAYFDISQFPQDLRDDFRELSDSLITPQTKGVILDLRNNPGGYVSAAEDLLYMFLGPKEKMYTLDYRNGQKIARSFGMGVYANQNVVILVDGSTASAAEIVAAAMQENGRATVIGQQTFGKGVAQQLFFYEDGSSLKLTIAEWLTPKGNRLNKYGVTPDIVLADNEKTDIDEILERGLRFLKDGR